MPYLPFLEILLERVNPVLLFLKLRFQRLRFSNTRLELIDTSPRLFEFKFKFNLLLLCVLSISILSLFQVLPVSELRESLGSFVLSKLE